MNKMKNFRLLLCYDGTRYKGWQKQGNTDNTIQEKLETLLSRILSQQVEIAGSGRTDAGVHAEGQVCSFRADTELLPELILAELRKYLPEDIGAISLEYAPERFHARLSCKEKTYTYTVWNSEAPNVFSRKYMYSFPAALDVDAMERAAALLIGEHDFAGYQSNRRMKKSTVRKIKSIEILPEGSALRFVLTGDGFLYNMVRIIVGTLLEVGTYQRSIESTALALTTLERTDAGFTAPPQGLCLTEVRY